MLKFNRSQYITLFAVSSSMKKLVLIDCVNIYFLNEEFLVILIFPYFQ